MLLYVGSPLQSTLYFNRKFKYSKMYVCTVNVQCLPCMYCMKNYICCVRMQAQRCALRIELFMLFLLNLSSCYFIFLIKTNNQR